jgi:hypothetical protein
LFPKRRLGVLYTARRGRIVKVSLSGNEQRWTWSFKRQIGKGYEMGDTDSRAEAMAAFRRAWNSVTR